MSGARAAATGMFTGLIADLGSVADACSATGDGAARCASPARSRRELGRGRLGRGQRRVPDGHRACATASFGADAMTETLARTSLGDAGGRATASTSSCRCAPATGSAATSCRATSTASARCARSREDGFSRVRRRSRRRRELLRYVVEKGSVAVDGVSLTVSALRRATASPSR